MIGDTGQPRDPDPDRAAALLAELVNKRLGADADAKAVKRLIREKWGTLSPLAHAVHNGERP